MTKSRLTSDVWSEQNKLARAYSSEDEPRPLLQRLADVWIRPITKKANIDFSMLAEEKRHLTISRRSRFRKK